MSYLYKTSKDLLTYKIIRSRLLPTFLIPYNALFINHHLIFNNLNTEKDPVKTLDQILKSYSQFKIMYTDGSKSTQGCGYGIYMKIHLFLFPKKLTPLHPYLRLKSTPFLRP